MKKLVALVLAAIMLLTMTSVFAEEKKVITMWCIATESDANRPAYEAAIAAYEAAHPDVKIEWDTQSPNWKYGIMAIHSGPIEINPECDFGRPDFRQ